VTEGQMEPAFELDSELHYQPTTWPGARIPHCWIYDQAGRKHSTLDLTGKGRFTILTGISGEGWAAAAAKAGKALGIDIATVVIGPRRAFVDHEGEWARGREVGDSGCVLVRPDHHVAWRAEEMVADPAGELTRVLSTILDRNSIAVRQAAE
jgi:2,4-dichlorophenol 6-monooxygenase